MFYEGYRKCSYFHLNKYSSVSVDDDWSGVELEIGRTIRSEDYHSKGKDNRSWSEIVSGTGMGRK